MSSLTNLQLLWLNDNKLVQMPDTSRQMHLRTLWLCGNEIDTIGSALLHNTRLKELNLANNKVSEFVHINFRLVNSVGGLR